LSRTPRESFFGVQLCDESDIGGIDLNVMPSLDAARDSFDRPIPARLGSFGGGVIRPSMALQQAARLIFLGRRAVGYVPKSWPRLIPKDAYDLVIESETKTLWRYRQAGGEPGVTKDC
jgi:hypothetical protein